MAVDYIDVLPDIRLPRTASFTTMTTIRGGIGIGVDVEFDEVSMRYVITSAIYTRQLDVGGLTVAEIHAVGIWDLVEKALPAEIDVAGRESLISMPKDGRGVRDLPTAEALLMTARKYALSRAMGRSPLKDVAEWLGVSRATAARDVARAREAGLLDG